MLPPLRRGLRVSHLGSHRATYKLTGCNGWRPASGTNLVLQRRSLATSMTGGTLSNRVFYKSDGTPRSKLKGIGFFSVGLMAYLLFEAVAAIDELDNAVNNLSTLVNIQRVDHHCFATTDLSNFEQTLALYKQFYNSVLFTVGEESAAVTEAFEQLDEFEENDAHLHSILKKACEDVHATLQDNSGSTSQIVIAQKIIIILDQSLAEVFAKLNARLVSSISEMQQERAAKDARGEGGSTASEDYEVVG